MFVILQNLPCMLGAPDIKLPLPTSVARMHDAGACRCLVPELGIRYPPMVARCLRAIANMTLEQVQERYLLPWKRDAEVLQMRATDMITKGAEAVVTGWGGETAGSSPMEGCSTAEARLAVVAWWVEA